MEWYQFALFGVLSLWLTRAFARGYAADPKGGTIVPAIMFFFIAVVMFVLAIVTL